MVIFHFFQEKFLYVKPLPCHKLEDKDNGEHQQGDAKVLKLKAAELHDHIAKHAKADAVGNTVTKNHGDHCYEGGERLGHVGEVDLLYRVEHEHAHHNESATGSSCGDEHEQRGEEEGEDEEQTCERRCQSAASALGNA